MSFPFDSLPSVTEEDVEQALEFTINWIEQAIVTEPADVDAFLPIACEIFEDAGMPRPERVELVGSPDAIEVSALLGIRRALRFMHLWDRTMRRLCEVDGVPIDDLVFSATGGMEADTPGNLSHVIRYNVVHGLAEVSASVHKWSDASQYFAPTRMTQDISGRMPVSYSYWCGTPFAQGRLPGYAFLSQHEEFRELLPPELCRRIDLFAEAAKHVNSWIVLGDTLVILDRPQQLHLETRMRQGLGGSGILTRGLHNQKGPALLWRDGTALHVIHHAPVPEYVIEGDFAPASITAQGNLLIRRAMIEIGAEKHGARWVTEGMNAIALDTTDDVTYWWPHARSGTTLTVWDFGDIGDDDGRPCIVVELLEGGTPADGGGRELLLRARPEALTVDAALEGLELTDPWGAWPEGQSTIAKFEFGGEAEIGLAVVDEGEEDPPPAQVEGDLPPELSDALGTWSNVGQPGPPPSERFVPDAASLEHFTPISKKLEFEIRLPLNREGASALHLGHRSFGMEDKWDVYTDDDRMVHFHRSWTGLEMFRLQLVEDEHGRFLATKLEVETDPECVGWSTEEAIHDFVEVLVWVFDFDAGEVEASLWPAAEGDDEVEI